MQLLLFTVFVIFMICAVFASVYIYLAAKLSKCTMREYIHGMLENKFVLVGTGCVMSSATTWFMMMIHSMM